MPADADADGGAVAALPRLFLISGLCMTGQSMVMPVFQFFQLHTLGMTQSQVGQTESIFQAAGLVGNALSGRLSDAAGRQPILVVCLLGAGIQRGLTLLTNQFAQFLLVQVIGGLFSGFVTVATSAIGDLSTDATRAGHLGRFGMISGLSIIPGVGMTVAALKAGATRRVPFGMASVVLLATAGLAASCFSESLKNDQRKAFCHQGNGAVEGARCSVVTIELLWVFVVKFCAAFPMLGFFSIMSKFVEDVFDWGPSHMAVGMLCMGLFLALITGVVFPIVRNRLGKLGTVMLATVLGALGMACLAACARWEASRLLVYIAGAGLLASACGLLDPGLADLAISFVHGDGDTGIVLGMLIGMKNAASVAAPIVTSMLYDSVGASLACLACGSLPFALAFLASIGVGKCGVLSEAKYGVLEGPQSKSATA